MKSIMLTHGNTAIVDDEDFEEVSKSKWHLDSKGYAAGCRDGVKIRLHCFIIGRADGVETDHRNGDKLDCRRENLRSCTHQQNLLNKSVRRDSTSGIKGVVRRKTGKWSARICVNGRRISIGCFLTAEEASAAYEKSAQEVHGDFRKKPHDKPAAPAPAARPELLHTNTSGYPGVGLLQGKWSARIRRNGKSIYIGSFESKERAFQAREEFKLTLL